MQSPRDEAYDDQGKGKERVADSLTTAKDENDNDNLFDLSTSQKNKKRVHYPQTNGEHPSSSGSQTIETTSLSRFQLSHTNSSRSVYQNGARRLSNHSFQR